MKQSQLTLHSALYQLQQLNATIRLTPRSIAIWAPNKRIPSAIRQVIKEHTHEIRDMIEACHIDVCPSPHWHSHEWHYPDLEWTVDSATCGVCKRLAYIGECKVSKPSKSNFEKIAVKANSKERENTHA